MQLKKGARKNIISFSPLGQSLQSLGYKWAKVLRPKAFPSLTDCGTVGIIDLTSPYKKEELE